MLTDEFKSRLTPLFGHAAIAYVENTLLRHEEKPQLFCQIRQKYKNAKTEEIIRQLWIYRLRQNYHYPVDKIAVEFPITFGRDTSKRADIVVFDEDRKNVPYILIEVKETRSSDGKAQLRSYAHATGAPLALWSNGYDSAVWHRKNPNYFVEISDIPTASQSISEIINQPWQFTDLAAKEQEREQRGEAARTLREIIVELEDEVLANAGVDVFEEVFKLIFTKLYDELACFRGRYQYLRFRNSDTAAKVKRSVQSLFDAAKDEWPGVFASDDRIKLSPDHLQVCVGSIEEIKLFNSNLDVIDDAFEYLVNKSSKGEKGQYFTPRWVIDLAVKILQPKETESIVDTAAGSAGFTVHTMFHVWRRILAEEGYNQSEMFTLERKPQRCYDYVANRVFAIDFDEKSVRVARCLNLIAGDGQTNVLHLNTLDWNKWEETVASEEWRDTYNEGWRRLKRYRKPDKSKSYRYFDFDILMANPPFAGDIKQSDLLSAYDLAHKNNGKVESRVGRDLLFIERNLDFLRPGGRLAIILPQGRFNNANDARVRKFIMDQCRILAVVGLHPNTFKPHTGTKTSILFAQKWNDDPRLGPLCPKKSDYPIFFAVQNVAPKDSKGEKLFRRKDDGRMLRDSHGHYVVAHDLFSHEGITDTGIAERFQEFAATEGLSFAEVRGEHD